MTAIFKVSIIAMFKKISEEISKVYVSGQNCEVQNPSRISLLRTHFAAKVQRVARKSTVGGHVINIKTNKSRNVVND